MLTFLRCSVQRVHLIKVAQSTSTFYRNSFRQLCIDLSSCPPLKKMTQLKPPTTSNHKRLATLATRSTIHFRIRIVTNNLACLNHRGRQRLFQQFKSGVFCTESLRKTSRRLGLRCARLEALCETRGNSGCKRDKRTLGMKAKTTSKNRKSVLYSPKPPDCLCIMVASQRAFCSTAKMKC